jgi:hypothetical protein
LFVKLPSDIEAHDEVERFDVVRVQGTAQDERLLKLYTRPPPEPSPGSYTQGHPGKHVPVLAAGHRQAP